MTITRNNPRTGPARLLRQMSAALALAALVATGCSAGDRQESGFAQENGNDVEVISEDGEPPVLLGARAIAEPFEFEAPMLDSTTTVNGVELYDNAPLIMVFTVPSCPICVTEGPKLASAAEANSDISFVIVHSFGETDYYREYTQSSGLFQENVIHIVDQEGVLWDRFGVSSQPSSVLVDTSGRITSSRGALGDDGLIRAADIVRQ